MEMAQALVSGMLMIVGYVVVFFGVYKIYQIATDIREMKEWLQGRKSGSPSAASPAPLAFEDSATAYAEKLLRVVNEDQRTKTPTGS